jgi:hypothetical protein
MNIWAGIILAAVAAGVYGLSRLKHAGDNLATEIKGRVHSVDFEFVTLAIDAILKNPTNTLLTIQYPFIEIHDSSGPLASSTIVNKMIDIKPMTQTTISGIKLPVRILKLGSLAPILINRVMDKTQKKNKTQKITFQVTISTKVNAGGAMIPYKQTIPVDF